ERICFGHSGRRISAVGTPHRLSVLFERFKWRLVTRVLGLPLFGAWGSVRRGVCFKNQPARCHHAKISWQKRRQINSQSDKPSVPCSSRRLYHNVLYDTSIGDLENDL